MPSAEGFIKATAGGRFSAVFMIAGLRYNFSGAFTSSAPPYECRNAVLSYTDIRTLSSTHNFSGQLGPDTVTLTLDNGPTISGTLDMPISPGSSVSGSGVWTQNLDGQKVTYDSD